MERTDKAEIRPEERSEETESCRENLWNEIQLKEAFIKRYIVEGTNKAEIGPEEQSEETESCRENLWNEIQMKGPERLK